MTFDSLKLTPVRRAALFALALTAPLALTDASIADAATAKPVKASSRAGRTAPSLVGDLPFSQLPLTFQRRAAQRLEDMRAMEQSSIWVRGVFAPTVRTFYRPDIAGPAYYELSIFTYDTNQPVGFIILSATDKDFPIVHTRASGPSMSQRLINKAQAAGFTATKFYKLDSLSYAAEDAQGNLVAQVGNLPNKIVGDLGYPGTIEESTWIANSSAADDQSTNLGGALYDSDPDGSSYTLTGFASWAALKSEFTQNFSVLLNDHASNAGDAWTVEQAALQNGEGLRVNQVYHVAFVYGGPQVSLTGTGQQNVSTQIITRPGVPGALRVTVNSTGTDPKPLNVTLSYPNGVVETVKLMIVPEAILARTSRASAISSSWSAWTTYSAGSSSAQRDYDQIDSGDSPNTSSCASGCGPTAWAMLFGWGDYQAHNGNAYWAGRTGLYRVDGGHGSTSAIAPSGMDDGIKEVMWEMNGDMDTWCTGFGENAATYPWRMDDASDYLDGRTSTDLDMHYNGAGIHETRLREYARDSIRDNDTPAVIGTGWLEHYPLAWQYRWRSRTVKVLYFWEDTEYDREFYVNDGGAGSSGDGWIDAETWFAGEIYP